MYIVKDEKRFELKYEKLSAYEQRNNIMASNKLEGMKNLSPSGFSSWSKCNGFAYSKSNRTTEAARAGTQKHDNMYAELIQFYTKQIPLKSSYPLYIKDQFNKIKNGSMSIERPLIHKHNDKFYTLGFADCYMINEDDNTIEVIDYKSGHVIVQTQNNYQLMLYAWLIKKSDEKNRKVLITIHQGNAPYTHEVTDDEFESMENILNDTLDKLKDNNIEYRYSPSCNFCFNKSNCKVFYAEKLETFNKIHGGLNG